MNTSLVTAPSGFPISEEEVRDHLRIDDDRDEAYIKLLIPVVTSMAEQITRRALLTQTWKLFLDCFPDWEIEIPFAPLQSITHVKYYDLNETLQTVSSANYLVDSTSEPGRITPKPFDSWPIPNYDRIKAVEIQFVAGYLTPQAIPVPIKQAMLIMLSHLYENREPVIVGTSVMQIPMSLEYLLWPYRVLRFF